MYNTFLLSKSVIKIELEEELASKGNEGAQNELMKSMIDIIS